MEATREGSIIGKRPTEPVQAPEQFTIEAETIFKAALTKLGSSQHKIQFQTTNDHKCYATIDVEIDSYPYKENPKKATIYSYFHDTIEAAKEDVYSEAVAWLQLELNLIVDTKTAEKLREAQRRLQMSTAMMSIIEQRCDKATTEAARINNHRELAMVEKISTAEKLPAMLSLTENTTPLRRGSTGFPHMVYMGQNPPRNEKEQLAEFLCKVYTLLKLA